MKSIFIKFYDAGNVFYAVSLVWRNVSLPAAARPGRAWPLSLGLHHHPSLNFLLTWKPTLITPCSPNFNYFFTLKWLGMKDFGLNFLTNENLIEMGFVSESCSASRHMSQGCGNTASVMAQHHHSCHEATGSRCIVWQPSLLHSRWLVKPLAYQWSAPPRPTCV